MKFTLTTYDCTLSHNAGYAHSAKTLEFAARLQELTRKFATNSGVKESEIFWVYVDDSDWCKNCLVLYAKVSPDWTPTPETDVWDNSYSPTWFPNTVRPFWAYLEGRGKCVNFQNEPPQNPHNLFRTEIRQ